MPELPEVETVARQLDPALCGRRLKHVEVQDSKLAGPDWERASGYRIRRVRRVGKRVVFDLTRSRRPPLWIAVHLRMTGRLIWVDKNQKEKKAVAAAPCRRGKNMPDGGKVPPPLVLQKQGLQKSPRLVLLLDRGEVRFYDTRRFGTVELLDAEPQLSGPALDPLSPAFTARALGKLLDGVRTPVKPWLLRQDRIAGIGNIYASEALHRAGVDPRRPGGSLSSAEVRRLRKAVNNVMCQAIAKMGTTFSDYADAKGESGSFQKFLRVYGRRGQPCRKCGEPIVQITQAQRSTFFCPHCQQ